MQQETDLFKIEQKMQQAIAKPGKTIFDFSKDHIDPTSNALRNLVAERDGLIVLYANSRDNEQKIQLLKLFEHYNEKLRSFLGL